MTHIVADTWKNLSDVTYNRSLQTVLSSPNTLYGNAIDNTTTIAVGSSPIQSYFVARTVTFTTKKANSSFLLMGTAQMYSNNGNGGWNLGFDYGGTLILGYNGASGDAWMGYGNGGPANTSNSRTRVFVHSPGVGAAGITISYSLMLAKWDTAGTYYWGGDGGYQNGILFSVTEIEN